VLLLDAPKKRIVNDAARAKDRVVDLDIKAVTPKTLTELLGLPGMRVEGFAVEEQERQEYLHLFCEHCHEVAICPRCGEAMVGGYGSEEQSVRHLDIWGMRTIIHFSRRRFDCTVCGKPFTKVLDWIDPKRRQTLASEQYIYECIHKRKMTRKQVALQEGLHEETVLDIFKRWGKRAVRRSERRPVRVLGIDEIYLGDKEYGLVLSDVADRFHVVKQLNHQLDLLRRNLRKNGDGALPKCFIFDLPDGMEKTICPALGAPEEQARYSLAVADVSLAAAQAQLDELRAGADADQVRAAQANVATAVAQWDAAQAQLNLLLSEATEEQIETTQATVDDARAALEQAQFNMADVGKAWQNGYAERLIRTIKEEEVDLS